MCIEPNTLTRADLTRRARRAIGHDLGDGRSAAAHDDLLTGLGTRYQTREVRLGFVDGNRVHAEIMGT